MVLPPTDDSWMNWNFEMVVVFEKRARPEYPERSTRSGVLGEKPFAVKERTNNKRYSYIASSPGF